MDQKEKNIEAAETVIKVAAHGGPMPLPFHEFFQLADKEPIEGKWYFSADCPHCQHTSPLFLDFSEGRFGNPFSGTGGFISNCHFCRKTIKAHANQVKSFHWL